MESLTLREPLLLLPLCCAVLCCLSPTAYSAQVCDVLSGAVLPGLTQHYSNMGLANMIWDVMAHMPFPYRAEVRLTRVTA